MSPRNRHNAWDGIIDMPLSSRVNKPRETGLTMIMDKGLGLEETSELLSVAGGYIDFIKLAFGTAALYNTELLQEKISLVRSRQIHIYPGGTFLEIALMQGKMEQFMEKTLELGFSALEISDGTIPLSPQTRLHAIQTAARMGFKVLTESGKKDPNFEMNITDTITQIESDLEAGAEKVIVEARESGKGIGIFNNTGDIKKDEFDELVKRLPDVNSIIWEAPLKNQQQELIKTFGPNVNLGNIAPVEILALESLRLGLRGDTLKMVISQYM